MNNGTIMKTFSDNTDMYVGALTVDEVIYAGLDLGYVSTINNYLINTYQYDGKLWFWTLTPSSFSQSNDAAYAVTYNRFIQEENLISSYMLTSRPSVFLLNDTAYVSGDGTQSNPYVIK